MKPIRFLLIGSAFAAISTGALSASIEIDVEHEIDLKDGSYLARELGGQGRYALIGHGHGRFEGGDTARAVCTGGFPVSQVPSSFNKVKKVLRPADYVLTKCVEAH